MPLSVGERLGPYEILAQIGVGGMGEVYRARDSRLGRDVAIKVSKEQFSERFDREARAVAALNHPNICTLFDVGPNYLVMEYVEGEAPRGPLPLDESLRIARQIAAALEAAHEKNIVHRDLKPGNIKIKADGSVKVLDFGLAKVTQREGVTTEDSPTMSMAATQAGVVLGTAAYMSPEQARGKPVDRRADIWAFGVVFYELLTGERLFQGEDLTETLASVVKERPHFELVPAQVRPLLERCLEKDPKNRLRDIGDMELLLGASTPQHPAPRRQWLAWAVAGLFLASTAAITFFHLREVQPEQRTVRFQIPPPDKLGFQGFQLSPDGRWVVFVAAGKLWLRGLDLLQPQPLPGTEGVSGAFWSPDSQYIAFAAQGKLKKMAASGGPAQTLCDLTTFAGGTWSAGGVILFSRIPAGLFRVSDAGGIPVEVSKPGQLYLSPEFLPDGKHYLYTVVSGKVEDAGIHAGSLDAPEEVRLLPDIGNVRYAATASAGAGTIGRSGYLMFLRSGTLMAQAFDSSQLSLTGPVFPVVESVASFAGGFGLFSLSNSGALAYLSGAGAATYQLVWKDRAGKSIGKFGPPGSYDNFRLSPDEHRIVYNSPQGNDEDIWVLDSVRGVPSRLTFDPASDNVPMWSPDGLRIVWPSRRSGSGFDLYVKAANGTGQEEILVKMGTANGWGSDWSTDGRYLLYQRPGDKTGQDLWIAPQETAGGDHKPVPYLQTQFDEKEGKFSPDGRWVAYVSNESGQDEIYVQSFPLSGAKFQISTGGATEAQWRKDGTELFYRATDLTLMVVPIAMGRSPSQSFQAGSPKPLFGAPLAGYAGIGRSYAVSNDGQRFLVPSVETGGDAPPLTVVLNWHAGLKK